MDLTGPNEGDPSAAGAGCLRRGGRRQPAVGRPPGRGRPRGHRAGDQDPPSPAREDPDHARARPAGGRPETGQPAAAHRREPRRHAAREALRAVAPHRRLQGPRPPGPGPRRRLLTDTAGSRRLTDSRGVTRLTDSRRVMRGGPETSVTARPAGPAARLPAGPARSLEDAGEAAGEGVDREVLDGEVVVAVEQL